MFWNIIGKDVSIDIDSSTTTLAKAKTFKNMIVAEYVWLDACGMPRSKTKTLTNIPLSIEACPIWNFDGSSTNQAEGHFSEIILKPCSIFSDPFRQGNHIIILCECYEPSDNNFDTPAKGNYRYECNNIMKLYNHLEPWFGIEQEFTLMRKDKIGIIGEIPEGFNKDGSEPHSQGPYYCGVGCNFSIGREVIEEHYSKCLYAGIKISGINAEVCPGQWEYQVGPCQGVEVADHMIIARYILLRITEKYNYQVSFSPKPIEGDWNGAGCHTNFSISAMREPGGFNIIKCICEKFGEMVNEHMDVYGDDNDKRLTGMHETCNINQFKWGVGDRSASIRIPVETEKNGQGYLEDRRPSANCDPYRVTARILLTTGKFMDCN
tara:strand:+ start:3255 stop:4388 length:1134 start_codon:yes stop_codon:yes gene_type:complete